MLDEKIPTRFQVLDRRNLLAAAAMMAASASVVAVPSLSASAEATAALEPMKWRAFYRERPYLFTAADVAQILGVDPETIEDWVRKDLISRASLSGGRFARSEVHKAALAIELLDSGFAPPVANRALDELKARLLTRPIDNPPDFKAYAIVAPHLDAREDYWVRCCLRGQDGLLYAQARPWQPSTKAIELPPPPFVLLPISDIFARVDDNIRRVVESQRST